MSIQSAPKVLLLDGDYDHTLAVARELNQQLSALILGVSSSKNSHLSRSRHTHKSLLAPTATDPSYGSKVLAQIEEHLPDVVLPVGYHSTAAMVQLREHLPPSVQLVAPAAEQFSLAVDKIATYEQARLAGIRSPIDYTSVVNLAASAGDLPYPLVAKARHERGGSTISVLQDASDFLAFTASQEDYEYLYQEYIDASEETHAFSGFFLNGDPVVGIAHEEKRSVPRKGGSGTRVRSSFDEEVTSNAIRLMRSLNWSGIAQVEFKRDSRGELVLMEINPKVWASYALASRAGAHVVSAAVAHAIGAHRSEPKYRGIEMVFPLREGYYVSKHDEENVLAAIWSMLWPPARPDLELMDLRAYLPKRK